MARKPSKKVIKNAILGSAGIVSAVASRLGVEWITARRWIDSDPDLFQTWQDERDKLLDSAEAVLVGKIKNQDEQTAKWVLSRLGKQRGYGDNVDVTSGGDKIELIVKYADRDNTTEAA